ncbi:MAG: molybdenum cofactor guanylyltransferase MobA [Methylophilaceae bacterium]
MDISAIILSGGRATRMGGVDKGLIQLQDKPLIQHVITRLEPQADEIFINANREIPRYQAFNLPVLQDDNPDFLGPLAGFSLGLKHCKHQYLLTVPNDSPMIAPDLTKRLLQALLDKEAEIAVAKSESHAHPVFCLMKKTVWPSLSTYLEHGERKVSAWQKSLKYTEVEFNDCNEAFVNLNTFEELEALALTLSDE